MIKEHLQEFVKKNKIKGKGALSVMLVITRRAMKKGLPLNADEQLTEGRGQVYGLGKAQVQTILKEYGITRVLAEEAGRTSRGSIKKMQLYVAFLNSLHKQGLSDLKKIESWWIDKVKEFFAGHPFKMNIDQSRSLHSIINDLLKQAQKRQQEAKGSTITGTVMQHLVGAKLELALSTINIDHHGASVADSSTDRPGDFVIGDSVIHVTTSPTEALLSKCRKNIDSNMRPIIVTTKERVDVALALAENISIKERLDVLDVLQFVATNIYELSDFNQSSRPMKVIELVEKYNLIVDSFETDPSLRIEVIR